MTSHNQAPRRWGKDGKGYETQQLMWHAIQKYGWNNVKHIVILSNVELEVALETEKALIAKYNTQCSEFGYNVSNGGDTNAGYHHTTAYKENLRRAMLGRYKGENSPCYGTHLSKEQRCQISKSLTGRKQSDETKRKRSESLKGHLVSREVREKISNSTQGKSKGLGREGYWKGKKQSDETCRRRSVSLKGKPKSPETREKLRQAMLGKKHGPMTEEQKLKISLATKGKCKHRKAIDHV